MYYNQFKEVKESKENSACLIIKSGYIPNKFEDKYGIKITKNELIEFKDFLYQTPLLGIQHEVGKKLYTYLKKYYDDNDNNKKLEENLSLFRGRMRSKDKDSFKKDQLWNPPKGYSSHGRYNMVGCSVLYCCDTLEGISYEINPTQNDMIDVLELQVKKEFICLDLDELFEGIETIFKENNDGSLNLKKSYMLTCFISDCCMEIGFDVIKYQGFKKEYINYAFLKFEKELDLISLNKFTYEIEINYNLIEKGQG